MEKNLKKAIEVLSKIALTSDHTQVNRISPNQSNLKNERLSQSQYHFSSFVTKFEYTELFFNLIGSKVEFRFVIDYCVNVLK